jgi:hypothetical protein
MRSCTPALLLFAAIAPAALPAQDDGGLAVAPPSLFFGGAVSGDRQDQTPDQAGPTPRALASDGAARSQRSEWWAPVVSAVIPGGGQVMLRQTRALPYLAIEAFALRQYFEARGEARSRRRDYREIARLAARARFGGPTPVGDFEYYERMEHFLASGRFDIVPGGSIEPETDVSTFNGSTWLLARQTFWEDPEAPPPVDSPQYQQALQFYSRRAVGTQFQWSWEGAELEQDHFRRTIRRSNDAFREASQFLGVLLANHALSAVDALITVRLHQTSDQGEQRIGMRIELPWPRGGATGAARPRS